MKHHVLDQLTGDQNDMTCTFKCSTMNTQQNNTINHKINERDFLAAMNNRTLHEVMSHSLNGTTCITIDSYCGCPIGQVHLATGRPFPAT